MKPLVVVDENIPGVEELLEDIAIIRAVAGRDIDADALAGAQALLVRSVTPVNSALVSAAQLRFIGSATSGTDHVDLQFLQDRGITFAHAPGSNANSVVEYVLAAIATVPGKLEQLLAGGRVGIVGFGIIGRLMAARLGGLGIECCAYDPWLDSSTLHNPSALEDVLSCDVVTVHAELTHRQPWPSHHLLGARALSHLKPGALLINASRGAVVDNQALLQSLGSREPAYSVVLDVWEGEPEIHQGLLGQVLLGTPHIAGYSYDGKLLATRMLCEKLAATLGWDLPATPLLDTPPLALASTSDDAQLIRQALESVYDIRADDHALRAATLGSSPGEASAAFDRARKEYPKRRELFGTTVTGEGFSESQLGLLTALGCDLNTRDEEPGNEDR